MRRCDLILSKNRPGIETDRFVCLLMGLQVGYFAFGGSTIVVLFKPNTVQFDQDLLTNSKHSVRLPFRNEPCQVIV